MQFTISKGVYDVEFERSELPRKDIRALVRLAQALNLAEHVELKSEYATAMRGGSPSKGTVTKLMNMLPCRSAEDLCALINELVKGRVELVA